MDEDWMRHGNCVGVDINLFFPPQGGPTAKPKAICADCPVKEECLEYALNANGQVIGIWGGTSELDRKRIRRSRNKKTYKGD